MYRPKPEAYSFVLAGHKWLIPNTYSIIRDGESEVSSLRIYLQYPDMSPRHGLKTPDDNLVVVSITERAPSEKASVAAPTLALIKRAKDAEYGGAENGFDVFRRPINDHLWGVYWFKRDESQYSMFVDYVDSNQFYAYNVTRSLRDTMKVTYSVQKVHMSEFEDIDARIVEKANSFIQGSEK